MAAPRKKGEGGVVGRLAERGEEAMSRLMDEVGRHQRVTDVFHRASEAKGKFDDATRKGVSQMGLASLDELKALRKQVAALEKRLAKLESGSTSRPAAGRAQTTTKRSTGGAAAKRATGGGASQAPGA